jgi:hypothetical protein
MAKPISDVPETFADATVTIPLADLDTDFAYVVTKLNDVTTPSNYVADSGTVNTLVLNYPAGVVFPGLEAGLSVQFKPANQNTSTVTLQIKVNSVDVSTAKSVLDSQGNPLTTGLLKTSVVYTAIYTGSSWVVLGLNPAISLLPPIAGNALKVLQVNSGATATEWATSATLPSLAGNALKYLQVNSGETATQWGTVASLPSTTGNNGRFLRVDSSGNAIWDAQTSIATTLPDSRTFRVGTTTNGSSGGIDLTCSSGTGSSAGSTIRLFNANLNSWGSMSCAWTSEGATSGNFSFNAPVAGGYNWSTTPFGGSTSLRATLDNSGNFSLQSAGTGFRVKEGSNAKMGTATLTTGSVTVSNTSVTANSRIFLTTQVGAGTVGYVIVSARTPGSGFTITSSSSEDTSTIAYIIFEPS